MPFWVLGVYAKGTGEGLAAQSLPVACPSPPPSAKVYLGVTKGPGPPRQVGSLKERPCSDCRLCASSPLPEGMAAAGRTPVGALAR